MGIAISCLRSAILSYVPFVPIIAGLYTLKTTIRPTIAYASSNASVKVTNGWLVVIKNSCTSNKFLLIFISTFYLCIRFYESRVRLQIAQLENRNPERHQDPQENGGNAQD